MASCALSPKVENCRFELGRVREGEGKIRIEIDLDLDVFSHGSPRQLVHRFKKNVAVDLDRTKGLAAAECQ
jgi:hypothetical protein